MHCCKSAQENKPPDFTENLPDFILQNEFIL